MIRKAALLALFCSACASIPPRDEAEPAARWPAARALIESRFLREVDTTDLETRALKSLLESIDPYSSYLDAREWAAYEASFGDSYAGVGVRLAIDAEVRLPRVEYVLFDTSAARAGIVRGDHIAAIDGQPLQDRTLDAIIPMLLGPEDTLVTLELQRDLAPAPLSLLLTRTRVEQPSVRGRRWLADGAPDYRLDRDGNIGYVRIIHFGLDTTQRVEHALTTLSEQGARSLVLDLRDCGGGMADAAIGIADLLLDDGVIVTTRERERALVVRARPGVAWSGRVALLINRNTASSAEILAGALIDHGRATLVGERSFGKGRIQHKLALGPGMGGIIVSTGTFQRPSGTTIDRHDSADPESYGLVPLPEHRLSLPEAEESAWSEAMQRLDGRFVLSPAEQEFPDPVLDHARALLMATAAPADE
jgi:carboxyl-terminal processing protease